MLPVLTVDGVNNSTDGRKCVVGLQRRKQQEKILISGCNKLEKLRTF